MAVIQLRNPVYTHTLANRIWFQGFAIYCILWNKHLTKATVSICSGKQRKLGAKIRSVLFDVSRGAKKGSQTIRCCFRPSSHMQALEVMHEQVVTLAPQDLYSNFVQAANIRVSKVPAGIPLHSANIHVATYLVVRNAEIASSSIYSIQQSKHS